jgi:lipoyl(octanoyl) transferase
VARRLGPTDELWVCHLGTVDYREALDLQERVRIARQADEVPDVMLMLEHWPVYTRGRRSGEGELPMGEDWYRAQGIDIVNVDRGGKITYHGPGQLVGYPIVALDEPVDVIGYVRAVEEALIRTCADAGLATERVDGRSGVWVRTGGVDRKVAAIGIRVARGVTMHGFALNCDNDLSWFGKIVPCGISDASVTSLSAELGRAVGIGDVLESAQRHIAEVVGASRIKDLASVQELLASPIG